MVSSCCLQLIKHDKKLRKTVENSLNALLRIRIWIIRRYFSHETFPKMCKSLAQQQEKSTQAGQGLRKIYIKATVLWLCKTFVDLIRIWQFWLIIYQE